MIFIDESETDQKAFGLGLASAILEIWDSLPEDAQGKLTMLGAKHSRRYGHIVSGQEPALKDFVQKHKA